MMHMPCGKGIRNAPCMSEVQCTKHSSKLFTDETRTDEDRYPIYRRRDDNQKIVKIGVELDNRYVVPHNKIFWMKYGAT